MNKKSLGMLLGISLLSTTVHPISAPCEQSTRKIMLGALFAIALYYEALTKPTDNPIELTEDASCMERFLHYLRYDLNLGQQEKKIGYKLVEFTGTTGTLKETKIKATGLGKLYVALKHCARLLSLPAVLIGISRSLDVYGIKPSYCDYVMPPSSGR